MKITFTLYFFLFATIIFAQSPGDYRTRSTANGINWGSSNAWETYNGSNWVITTTPPNNTNGAITITSPLNFAIYDNESITADQLLIEAGANLTVAGSLNLANGTGDDLAINGQLTVFDGNVSNQVANGGSTILVNVGGLLGFYGTSNLFKVSTTNQGTIELDGGRVTFYDNCTITNNGIANLSANRLVGIDGGFRTFEAQGANFVNNGTINSSAVTGFCTFGFTSFVNNGTLNAATTSITFISNASGTADDAFTFQNNGNLNGYIRLDNEVYFNAGTNVSGISNLENYGNLHLNTDISIPATKFFTNLKMVDGPGNLTLNNGSLTNTINGKYNGPGKLILATTSYTWNTTDPLDSNIGNRTIEINPGITLNLTGVNPHEIWGSIINNGTVNWTDGSILSKGFGTFTNNGIFNLNGTGWNSDALPVETVIENFGTIVRNIDAPLPLFAKVDNNTSGIININDGSLEFNKVINNEGSLNIGNTGPNPNGFVVESEFHLLATGTITTTSNSFIYISGILNLVANLNLPATVDFQNNGTIFGAGDLTLNNDFIMDGSISGTGSFTVNGNVVWNSGILARNFINNAGRTFTFNSGTIHSLAANLVNNGTVVWANGNISFAANKFIFNNSIFTINCDKTLQDGVGTGTFDNFGTILKSTAGQTSFNQNAFINRQTGIIKGTGIYTFNNVNGINAGKIEPGASPGILTINGNQPLTANSTLQIEINNTTGAGTGHDQLKRDGNLTLAGTLNVVEASNLPNGTYEIIRLNTGTLSGSFATTQLPSGYSVSQTSNSLSVVKNIPTSCTATSSGNWNNPAIWDCNQVPDETKAVVISSGITVTIPNAFIAKAKNLTNNGSLGFETSGQIILHQ